MMRKLFLFLYEYIYEVKRGIHAINCTLLNKALYVCTD